ncbi:MAG TPA: gluconate 2-dehydrogenase subunit 3 family protein [Solirubrobacteraceae bacterium]
MAPDFRRADHLPHQRGDERADSPYELPRQRRGRTPQMHGRYPDFDVLEQAGHWDHVTREMVLSRVHEIPAIRFFSAAEAASLSALCDLLTAQDSAPRIPLINYIDEKYDRGDLDGFQFDDMPDDRDAWRLIARGLDEQAGERAEAASFAAVGSELQLAIVADFADGDLHGGAWDELNVTRAFGLVMRVVLACFYSHPWAWNEIGFGGPAYPRGYSRFGSPDLQRAERETWEGAEHYDRDPVSGEREPPPQ